MQVSTEMTTPLDEQRLVDRLGGHPHLRPIREPLGQVQTDLLWAPVDTQLGLHDSGQFSMLKLARLGSTTRRLGPFLRVIK